MPHPLPALRRLQRRGAVAPPHGVDLDTGLIGPQVRLDAVPRAGERQHGRPGGLGGVLEEPKVVVALGAAGVGAKLGRVARVAQRARGRKVHDAWGAGGGTRDGSTLAGGEAVGVEREVVLRVGHVQGVVEHGVGVGVAVRFEVEVGVLGEHEGWGDAMVSLVEERKERKGKNKE